MCFSFTFLDFIVRVHRVSFNMYHLLTHDPTLGIAVFNGECLNCLIQIQIPREVAQENPRPPSILMKIDKPIVPHDPNMYATILALGDLWGQI